MRLVKGFEAVPVLKAEVHDHHIDAAALEARQPFLEPLGVVEVIGDFHGLGQAALNENGVFGIIFDKQDNDRLDAH